MSGFHILMLCRLNDNQNDLVGVLYQKKQPELVIQSNHSISTIIHHWQISNPELLNWKLLDHRGYTHLRYII